MCKVVTNNNGRDIAVPIGSNPEWAAFLAHLPASVTATNCTPTWVDGQEVVQGTVVTKPVGLKVGDLMIAYIYDQSNLSGVNPPSGFTQIDAAFNICNSYYVGTWSKLADASDVAAASFTFTRTGGWVDNGIMLAAITNVSQSTPIQVHTVTQGAGTTITYTGGTATQNNSMILAIGNICGSEQPAIPATFTKSWDVADAQTTFSFKIQSTAGATGNFTSSLGVSRTWAGSLFIINP